jgi:hypothetical protein
VPFPKLNDPKPMGQHFAELGPHALVLASYDAARIPWMDVMQMGTETEMATYMRHMTSVLKQENLLRIGIYSDPWFEQSIMETYYNVVHKSNLIKLLQSIVVCVPGYGNPINFDLFKDMHDGRYPQCFVGGHFRKPLAVKKITHQIFLGSNFTEMMANVAFQDCWFVSCHGMVNVPNRGRCVVW